MTWVRFSFPSSSQQYPAEWKAYSEIVDRVSFPVIHIRGNHDAFNEPDFEQSFYAMKSGSKATIVRNGAYDIIKSFGTYSFVAVDAASEPGFKRPFNFVGYIKDEGVDELRQIGQARATSNHSVWFGHYPTSSKSALLKIIAEFYTRAWLVRQVSSTTISLK